MDNRNDPDTIAQARFELKRFVSFDQADLESPQAGDLQDRPLAITTIPLLIFLCDVEGDDHPDPAKRAGKASLTPMEVGHELGLVEHMRRRKWCVRSIQPNTLDGIAEGLEWLVSNISS